MSYRQRSRISIPKHIQNSFPNMSMATVPGLIKKVRNNATILIVMTCCLLITGCYSQGKTFKYSEYPLERNGIALHLDCMTTEDKTPKKNILLIHGVTYSSHEFDIDYNDYSLVRRLAGEGYAVWRLDIAGFGQSDQVEDGFLPDSDYAAEDINAAVETIVSISGEDRIDILGWSWGTVTAGRFAAKHPEHINRLILYAPILCGVGEADVTEPFHHNTWEHAADDFQKDQAGDFDNSVTDPVIIEMFCSGCWKYDGEESPNGGRRDICVPESEKLIDLSAIKAPTLVICGSKDPYLNYDLVTGSLDELPAGSALEIIEGASHVAYIEKPYYKDFQNRLIHFLKNKDASEKWGETQSLTVATEWAGIDFPPPLETFVTDDGRQIELTTYRYRTGVVEALYRGDDYLLVFRRSNELQGLDLAGTDASNKTEWKFDLNGISVQNDHFSITASLGKEGSGLTVEEISAFLEPVL